MKPKKIIALSLACAIAFAPSLGSTVGADENSTTATETQKKTTSLFKIKQKKVDKSKTFTGAKSEIKASCYYTRVVLKGEGEGLKKINKKLKKLSKDFFNGQNGTDSIYEMAKSSADMFDYNDEFLSYAGQDVQFVNKRYVSITECSYWYAGGVHNVMVDGYVFNIKTGKQVKNITKFTKTKSLSRLKKKLKKKILSKYAEDIFEYKFKECIDDKKATEFNFYINEKGQVAICFNPYEIGAGAYYREYAMPGKYKKNLYK